MTDLTTLQIEIEAGTHDAALNTLLDLIGRRLDILADSDSHVCLLPSDLVYWRALSRDELAAKCRAFAVDTERVADEIKAKADKYLATADELEGEFNCPADDHRTVAKTMTRDASDMKHIAACISEGELAAAYHSATTVDTDVREQIPQKVWNVLYVIGRKLHDEQMATQS